MKQFVIFLILVFPFVGTAQHKLSGTLVDSGGRPVAYAALLLSKPQDSTVYKSSQSNEQGFFEFTNIEKGDYILKASSIGFEDKVANVSVQQDVMLPALSLKEVSEMLEGVEITMKRPIIKRKIDRMEFNVENSSLSTNNAWEILAKTPSITASSNGSLTVRGSSSILVTINDKKIYLSGEELKQFLENTNGEDVKSVEVITNPPAKYDAQGGIVVNIKLKKNLTIGYKGTVTGAYVQSSYPKGVVSTSQFYKGEKLSVTGRYTFGTGTYLNESDDRVRYTDDAGETTSLWKSVLRRKNTAPYQNSYRINADYEIDSLNTVSIGGMGTILTKSHGNYNVPTSIFGSDGELDSLYVTHNRRKYPSRNNAFNFSYEHKFRDKEMLTFSSDYTMYYRNENQDILSVFSLPDSSPYRDERFVSDNTQRIRLFSGQVDYLNEAVGFEAGAKYGKVKADNNLDYRDDIDGVLVINPGRTNKFLYDENIFAGYVSYSKEFGKWTLKGGLRGEYTQLEGNAVSTAEVNEQNYFKLFPTFYTLYKAAEGHELGFSYGKRISRPQYSWLNPFRSYYNSYSYFTGDPKLQPTITHNLNLTYTLKGKYNFDLYYRYEKDPSMEISYQDYETNTVVYHFTNIEKDIAYGLDFNTNLVFFDWWESGMQAGFNYVEDTFQGIDGGLYENGRWQYSGSMNNRFTLNKKKDFTAEANFYYNSPAVQGTFTISGSSSLHFAFRKKAFKGKWEFYALLSDVYKGQKQRVTTNYANQYTSFKGYDDSQSFRIGFKYNIGNQKLNEKSRSETEEQRRL